METMQSRRRVADLAAAPYNPRTISDEQLEALGHAMGEFGDLGGIVFNARLGRLVGGHQRLKHIPPDAEIHITQSFDSPTEHGTVALGYILHGGERWSYREVWWDELTEMAANIAANKHGGQFDLPKLAPIVLKLEDEGLDMKLTGFLGKDLEDLRLIANPSGSGGDGGAGDVVPAQIPANPRSKPGEIYQLGPHRIMCGDCRNPEHVAALFAGERINLAFTSPPYADRREYDESSGFRPIPPDEYVDWFEAVQDNVKRHLAIDGSWFVNIKPGVTPDGLDTELYVFDLVIAHVRRWGWHFATEFCWERNGVPKSVTRRFKNQFEPIYQFALGTWKMRPDNVRHWSENVPIPGGPGSGNTSWHNVQGGHGERSVSGFFGAAKKRRNGTSQLMSDVQGVTAEPGEFIAPGLAYPGNRLPTFAGTHQATGHTAAFPVGLPAFFIKAYTDRGDRVYDPFMGSGSTLIAAEREGRIAYGMEISPAYCDIIRQRYADFTNRPELAP